MCVQKKWMVAAEHPSNENFYQCCVTEPATNLRILFLTSFTNQCTNLGGYMVTTSNAKDFTLFPFLLLRNQPQLRHLPA